MAAWKQLGLNALVTALTAALLYGGYLASIQWVRVNQLWAWANAMQAQVERPTPSDTPGAAPK